MELDSEGARFPLSREHRVSSEEGANSRGSSALHSQACTHSLVWPGLRSTPPRKTADCDLTPALRSLPSPSAC